MRGSAFTWRSDNGKKKSKIDRFLVNSEFFNSWPEACLLASPKLWSDHCPLILVTKEVNFGARPFRIFNSWLNKDGFKEVVVDACVNFADTGCSRDLNLIRKLGVIRSKIKIWRDAMLKKDGEVRSKALEEVEGLEEVLELRDLTEEEEWVLAENKKVLADLDLAKNMDLKQRSRIRWAKEGDENSKFFHSQINWRKACNVIHGLNVGGSWVSKPSLVKKEVFSFFRSRFEEDCVSRPCIECPGMKRISDSDSLWLESTFSREEIRRAVFDCGDDRAPGPDGFNFRFFKHFWELFENDFVSLMADFYDSGVINVGCGSSFIALVPKKKDPLCLGDYRPISLVGVINKVVSKVLANRLKKVLDSVISDSQSAFLGGRYILDGPLIINEVCSWLKKSKRRAMMFKIDFEKAYDNINWKFVVDILRQMGFGQKWCNWVWGVLCSARASVLVNGSPTFDFKCSKGMRQGDPISPFLFTIVMETLSCLVRKAVEESVIKGIQLPNDGPLLSHLFFADDALLVGEWSEENLMNIVRLLRCFHICSGLKINVVKSSIFGVGVPPSEVSMLAGIVGCKADSFPVTYLGLKVGSNMSRVNNWRPLFDIFEARLSLWKSALLSFGGRITLVRSVLESLPSYYFSLYKAPVQVIAGLERLIKKFLWGGSSDVRKTHWVAWERLTLPKKKGGVGISRLNHINIALLSKWGWRYKREKNNMWVKVVDAIHMHGPNWSVFPVKKTCSGVWSSIVSAISKPVAGNVVVRDYFKGLVGNGECILFWLDPWLKDKPLKDVFPNLFALEVVKACSVRDRVQGDWLWRHEPEIGEELAEFASLLSDLSAVILQPKADGWRWLGDGSGSFSVSSVKSLLAGAGSSPVNFIFSWNKWVPSKCNLLAWKAEMYRVPTADALRKRGIPVGDGICPLCKTEAESADHIFTACYVAAVLWQKVSRWCRIPPIFAFSVRDLLDLHQSNHVKTAAKSVVQGIIYSAIWCLWSARNKAIFSGIEAKVENIFCELKSLRYLWFKYRSRNNHISWSDWCNYPVM
uniref:Putative RNA-directed DNA polymerase, eukaryota, Reverse transcriptase zinc-binding domain protein n=1 Tax=Helianthus annuus TaxID=4232 RepID=A0A251VRU4_HELAN